MTTTVSAPQAVCAPLTQYAIFIVATALPGGAAEQQIREVCADLGGLVRSISQRTPAGNLSCICAFGAQAWPRFFGTGQPRELHEFRALGPPERHAPGTPGDLFFHIRAEQMDLCFEMAMQLMNKLGGSVQVEDEVHGFRYFDSRSMVGFVDGTENPQGDEIARFALVGEEDTDFAGGSYVITQKYLHDMDGWDALPVEQQEKIIGRSKLDDIELDDEHKPSWAHNALTVIERDGEELKILRDNMPFGKPGSREFGTFFIGYARSAAITEEMLENMFVGNPEGNYDRLLDYSRAVTGNLFFVPSQALLDCLAD
ncbi:Dyp-type peroxidase [Marinobacter sp. Hex_13]|uniref:Dyp-type peroxidase n=1 Tax=Marinobacter sp. Hex_13 TaxID=1795866 RepID=UPI00079BE897|nr:Dyp-type peroxidase [Marinobacter sp. Hex_13]KXJ47748.1 MAG: peroxidase [Marinobacter sp. Hex_13]